MNRERQVLANDVFGSLAFYSEHHASSAPYQQHRAELVTMLRSAAENMKSTKPFEAEFRKGLADFVEKYC